MSKRRTCGRPKRTKNKIKEQTEKDKFLNPKDNIRFCLN